MNTPSWPTTQFKLDIGDHVPNIFGPDQHGGHFSVNRAPPGPFAILSVPAGDSAAIDAAIRAFDEVVHTDNGPKPNAVIAVVGPSDQVHGKARSLHIQTSTLADTRGQLAALFQSGRNGKPDTSQLRDGAIGIVTDPDQTIRSVVLFTNADRFKSKMESALNNVEKAGEKAHAHGFAPVLRIPHLLNSEQCRVLMATWETSHQPGKVAGSGQYGESINKALKKRVCYDHFIRENEPLHAQLISTIGPRIREAVERAFNFDIQCYEPFFIVAYLASEGGFFGSHRDNIDPAHMHRRFALTLNLNTSEYEGGGIWFPEYADTVYDPPAGDGVVFSCSLLHEAKVVMKGTRFILSGFMWSAAEETLRQRNAREAAVQNQHRTPVAG